jgi:ADP-heptose:LPS heptosyltransferase
MGRVLVFKIGAIGDVLMSTPFVRQLSKYHHVDYLVGKSGSVALAKNKHIKNIISFDESIFFKKRVGDFLSLVRTIRAKKYDAIYVLDKHWIFGLFAKLCGIKKRFGFKRGAVCFHTAFVRYGAIRHEAHYYLDLLALTNSKANYADYRYDVALSKVKLPLELAKPFVVLINNGGNNVGEQSQIRRMPSALFTDVVQSYTKKHTVVFIGVEREKAYYDQFVGKGIVNLCGKYTLSETAYVLSCAASIVTTDCGLMHIAGGVNPKHTLCVFGPTHPVRKCPKGCNYIWKDSLLYTDKYEVYGAVPLSSFFSQLSVADFSSK